MLIKQFQFLLFISCIYLSKCEKQTERNQPRLPTANQRETSSIIFDGRSTKNGTTQIPSNQTIGHPEQGAKLPGKGFTLPENGKKKAEALVLTTESHRKAMPLAKPHQKTSSPSDILDQIFSNTEDPVSTISGKEMMSEKRRFKLRVIKRNITNGATDNRRKPEGFKKHDKLALESQHIYVTVPPEGHGHPKTEKKSSKKGQEFQNVVKSVNFFVPSEDEDAFSIQKSSEVTLEFPTVSEDPKKIPFHKKKYHAKILETKIKSQVDRFDSQKQKIDERKVPVSEIGNDWSPKYYQIFEDAERREGNSREDAPDPKADLKKVYEKIFLEKIGEITETLANQDVPALFNDGPVIFGLFQAAIKPKGLRFGKSKQVKRSKYFFDNTNERKLLVDSQITSNQIGNDSGKSSEISNSNSNPKKTPSKTKSSKHFSTYMDPTKNTWKGMPSKKTSDKIPEVMGDDPNSWIGYSSPQYSFKYTVFNGENMFRRKFNGAPDLNPEPKTTNEQPFTVFDGAKVFQRNPQNNQHFFNQNQASTYVDLLGPPPDKEFIDHIGLSSSSMILAHDAPKVGGPHFMRGEEVVWSGPVTARLSFGNPRMENINPHKPIGNHMGKYSVHGGPHFDIKPAFRKFGSSELGVGFVRLGMNSNSKKRGPRFPGIYPGSLVAKRELGTDENVVVSKVEFNDIPGLALENATGDSPKVVEQSLELPGEIVYGTGNIATHPGNLGIPNIGLTGPNPYYTNGRSEEKVFKPFPTLMVPGIIGLRPPRPSFNFLKRSGKVKRVVPNYLPTAPYLPEKSYLLEPPRAFQKNLDLYLDPTNGVNQEVGIDKNKLKNSQQEIFGFVPGLDPFRSQSRTQEPSTKNIQRVTPIYGASAPKPIHLEPVLELLKSDRSKTKPVTELDSEITKLGPSKYHFDDTGYINDVPNVEEIPYGPPKPPKVVTNLEPKKIHKNLNKIFGIESVPFGARNASGFKLRKYPEENKALRIMNHRFSGSTRLRPSYSYDADLSEEILRNREVIQQINFLEGQRRQGSRFPPGLHHVSGGFERHLPDLNTNGKRNSIYPQGFQYATGFHTNSGAFGGLPIGLNGHGIRSSDYPQEFQHPIGFHTNPGPFGGEPFLFSNKKKRNSNLPFGFQSASRSTEGVQQSSIYDKQGSGFHFNSGAFGGHSLDFNSPGTQNSTYPIGFQHAIGFHTNSRPFGGGPFLFSSKKKRNINIPFGFQSGSGGFGGVPQNSFNARQDLIFNLRFQDGSGGPGEVPQGSINDRLGFQGSAFHTNFGGPGRNLPNSSSQKDRRGTIVPLGFQDTNGFRSTSRNSWGHLTASPDYFSTVFGNPRSFPSSGVGLGNPRRNFPAIPKVPTIRYNGQVARIEPRMPKLPDAQLIGLNNILAQSDFQNENHQNSRQFLTPSITYANPIGSDFPHGNFQNSRKFLTPTITYARPTGSSVDFQNENFPTSRQFQTPSITYAGPIDGSDEEVRDVFLRSENRNYNYPNIGPIAQSSPLYTEAIFRKFGEIGKEENENPNKPNVVQTSDKLDIYYFQ